MTDEPEFLRRWSRRKQAARKPGQPDGEPAEDARDAGTDGATQAAEGEGSDAVDSPAAGAEAPKLPDIDSLSADSDFTPFLKDGVPEELKNRALRKLWRVNPVFRRLDGLNDYDGDFTDSATVVKGLKTLYKVGRGFLEEPKPDPVEADAGNVPADAPQAAAEPGDGEAEPEPEEQDEPEDGGESGNNIS